MPSRGQVLCVAGEASGDAILAPVVEVIRGLGCDAIGVGGDAAAARGLEVLAHARDVAGHGIVEAVHTLPAVWRAWRAISARLPAARAVVLVDFPEVNLRLLRRAAGLGVPVVYLAPPQAWAWRAWRARELAAARWVGCLLPFEAAWYRARGVAAVCVGHPLAARGALPVAAGPGVALLPGSRIAAVRRLLPIQLAAAARLAARVAGLTVHVGVAATVDRGEVAAAFAAVGLRGAVHAGADAALARATVAIAGAGTATLHAALAGRPVVTMAALHPVSAAVARRWVRVEHVGLPNLVLGRRVFPEVVLDDCTPAAVAAAVEPLLRAPGSLDGALAELRRRVTVPDGAARVAGWVAEAVGARG